MPKSKKIKPSNTKDIQNKMYALIHTVSNTYRDEPVRDQAIAKLTELITKL